MQRLVQDYCIIVQEIIQFSYCYNKNIKMAGFSLALNCIQRFVSSRIFNIMSFHYELKRRESSQAPSQPSSSPCEQGPHTEKEERASNLRVKGHPIP